MPQQFWLLLETATGFCIANASDKSLSTIDILSQETLAGTADAVWQALHAQGYHGEPVSIALRAQSCLVAAFPHTGRSMVRNRQALAFAFEEFLPLAVEEFACDFVTDSTEVFGVAVELTAIAPLLSALRQKGVLVTSITPATLLAVQHLLKDRRDAQLSAVVCQDGSEVELIGVNNGKPFRWRVLSEGSESLALELKACKATFETIGTLRIFELGLAPRTLDVVRQVYEESAITSPEISLRSAMMDGAAAVMVGSETPWIELNREPLGHYDRFTPIRKQLKLLAASLVCFLILSSLAAWIQANRYSVIADNSRMEQEDIFRQMFPGKSMPVGIMTRLESECQKLLTTKGQGRDTPQLESVKPLLQKVLSSLPKDVRLRLSDLHLESGQVRLDGEVRQHGDADLLATGLRSCGFRVDAPRTEQLADKGVAVTLSASYTPNETGKKADER